MLMAMCIFVLTSLNADSDVCFVSLCTDSDVYFKLTSPYADSDVYFSSNITVC